MATEQLVGIASKLYEMRRLARSLLADKYAERMGLLREIIEKAQARLGGNELSAAQKLCEGPDVGPFDKILIMAAAVEMVEPSSPDPTPDRTP
jgi:hypothetical protein